MKLFQITEVTESFNHAGSKATADIAVIAEELGFSKIPVRMDSSRENAIGKVQRQWGYFRDWRRCGKEIPEGAAVLLQHPFHYKQLTREKTLRKLKEEKKVRFISLIHDVEELRAFRYSDYYAREFQTMLALADVLIVHNDVMREWFIQKGVPEKNLVSLEIFDYLQKPDPEKKAVFSGSISIAGNLDTQKCGYIAGLGELKNVKVNLYGPNFDERLKENPNIVYHGSFPVDEIPGKLTEGFGLVWDGAGLNGCEGLSGQYLRYNNPHKLSLYLSSGIPVIIWKEAAEASFVKKNHAGLCVDRVSDLEKILPGMTEEEYQGYTDSIAAIQNRLQTGYYARKAIQEALERLESRQTL